MRFEVIQAYALCCRATEALRLQSGEEAPSLPASVFSGLKELTFQPRSIGAARAANEIEGFPVWVEYLRSQDVAKVQLDVSECSPDYYRHTDPTWGLATDGEYSCELWHPRLLYRQGAPAGEGRGRLVAAAHKSNRWNATRETCAQTSLDKFDDALAKAMQFAAQARNAGLISAIEKLSLLQNAGATDLMAFSDLCPAEATDARRLLSSALRIMMVIQSPIWSSAAIGSDLAPEFLVNTQRLWHAAMVGLETSCAIRASAGPKDLAVPHSSVA